jgi:diacylglycerol kinase family enzyme
MRETHMHAYIYDSFVNTPKYKKELERIEVKLSRFGIDGKVRRLNILHHQKHEIEESIRRGAKTVVLVGNDNTIKRSVDIFARYDVAVGIIPLGQDKDNVIAHTLGIPPGDLACEVISRRRVVRLDLGLINGNYFLTTAELDAPTFACVGGDTKRFSIQPTERNVRLSIENLVFPKDERGVALRGNPRDGLLEVVLRSNPDRLTRVMSVGNSSQFTPSVFPIESLHITDPAEAIMTLDGCTTIKLPATIKVIPQKFRMIIGRERTFA